MEVGLAVSSGRRAAWIVDQFARLRDELPVRGRVRIREVDVVYVIVERMPNVDFLLSRGRVRPDDDAVARSIVARYVHPVFVYMNVARNGRLSTVFHVGAHVFGIVDAAGEVLPDDVVGRRGEGRGLRRWWRRGRPSAAARAVAARVVVARVVADLVGDLAAVATRWRARWRGLGGWRARRRARRRRRLGGGGAVGSVGALEEVQVVVRLEVDLVDDRGYEESNPTQTGTNRPPAWARHTGSLSSHTRNRCPSGSTCSGRRCCACRCPGSKGTRSSRFDRSLRTRFRRDRSWHPCSTRSTTYGPSCIRYQGERPQTPWRRTPRNRTCQCRNRRR